MANMRALLRKLKALAPQHSLYGILYSLLFGVMVIATFYAVRYVIPRTDEFYNEIVTVLFIVISVLILFPARDQLMRGLLKKYDYDRIFGGDYHHLDFIARQFQMETMIREIFPELMQWLRVRSGRIAILDPERKQYTYHIYKNGELLDRQSSHFQDFEDISGHLKQIRGILHSEDELSDDMVEFMERFRAVVLQPFIYRRNPVGFLILHDPPRHSHFRRAIELFAQKAAVSIHNNMLSNKVIEARMYEREFREASKIRRFLQNHRPPQIPRYDLLLHRHKKQLYLVEFLKESEETWFLIIICSVRYSGASGIILSGVLGHIYALFTHSDRMTLHRLLKLVRKIPNLMQSEYPMDFMIAEINTEQNTFKIMQDGAYRLVNKQNRDEDLSVPRWRRSIQLIEGDEYSVEHRNTPILDIRRRGK